MSTKHKLRKRKLHTIHSSRYCPFYCDLEKQTIMYCTTLLKILDNITLNYKNVIGTYNDYTFLINNRSILIWRDRPGRRLAILYYITIVLLGLHTWLKIGEGS